MSNVITINAETGEETIVELTAAEIAERESAYKAEQAKLEAEKSAAEQAKQAVLAKLGLTADEAKLLLA